MWFGLLVLRVSVGVTMVAHGYNHIYRGGKIKGTAGWFESLGMKPGILHAWLASLTELAAGAGSSSACSRPSRRARSSGRSRVAFITNHRKAGFFVFRRPDRGLGVPDEPDRGVRRDRVRRPGPLVARQRGGLPPERLGRSRDHVGDRRRRRRAACSRRSGVRRHPRRRGRPSSARRIRFRLR